MFFSISKHIDSNYMQHHVMGGVFVNVDSGWTFEKRKNASVLWKGYCDSFAMNEVVERVFDDTVPTLLGNFCVMIYDHSSGLIRLRSDLYRGFPIYVSDHDINNLRPSSHVVWSDSVIDIDQDLNLTENKFDLIGHIDTSEISAEDAKDFIEDRLHKKTSAFLSHNTLPIRAHLSGGVDSMLVFSFLQHHTDRYELVKCRHVDYDRFWLSNQTDITSHWGYTQIHHWKDPCVLTSGAPGDEYMLRSPTTGDLFLKFHGYNALDLMETDQWSDCLHKDYFHRPKHVKIFQSQVLESGISRQQLFWNLCNINANDWQHWHIGNTLTWTPLRDLEIFKILLRMPLSDCVGQFLDSQISRDLIRRNSTDLDQLISDRKNFKNPMKNLVGFLEQNPS